MKRQILILIIFLLFQCINPMTLDSQCLCADIEFQLELVDVEINNEETNYSIEVINAIDLEIYGNTERKILASSLEGNIAKLRFATGGGLDSLVFIIKNKTTKVEMKITALYMTYDNPYLIDLIKFESGEYEFDWEKISGCQTENPYEEFVECDEFKFYQLELKSEQSSYIPNKIRPYTLETFGKGH